MGFNDKAIRQELDNQIGGVAREMASTDDEKKKDEARRRARDLVRRRSYHVDDDEIATYGQRKEGFTYEEWKPFPKDKVTKQLNKKEKGSKQAKIMKAVSNYKTRNTDFTKADQKWTGSDIQKHNDRIQHHADKLNHHYDKADKHEEKANKAYDKGDKKKAQKHIDKSDKHTEKGNQAGHKLTTLKAVRHSSSQAKRSEDAKQAEINKKSKEDRAKVKRMAKISGLESALKKPAVSGAEKGFKKESLNFTEYLEAQCDPLYEVKGALPKCPPGYRYSMEQKQCVPKTDKDDVRKDKGGGKDSHPSNGPGYNVWGRTGVNGDGYAYAEPNAYEGNYYDGPSGGYYNE